MHVLTDQVVIDDQNLLIMVGKYIYSFRNIYSEVQDYRMTVYRFGAVSSLVCSSFALKQPPCRLLPHKQPPRRFTIQTTPGEEHSKEFKKNHCDHRKLPV